MGFKYEGYVINEKEIMITNNQMVSRCWCVWLWMMWKFNNKKTPTNFTYNLTDTNTLLCGVTYFYKTSDKHFYYEVTL